MVSRIGDAVQKLPRRPVVFVIAGCALFLSTFVATVFDLVEPSLWTLAGYLIGWVVASSAGGVCVAYWLGISTKRGMMVFAFVWPVLTVAVGVGLPMLLTRALRALGLA